MVVLPFSEGDETAAGVNRPDADKPLPAHIALRIALAARALAPVDTARLLRALIALVGEPLNEVRLARLRLGRLRQSLGLGAEQERQLQQAVGLLKGRGVRMPEEILPQPEPPAEGVDWQSSLRVACASNSGEWVDGRFGDCRRFLIYQVSADACRLVELREPPAGKSAFGHCERSALLADCHLLCALSVPGPAAAQLIRAGLHVVRLPRVQSARRLVGQVRQVLAGTPPPWMARAIGRHGRPLVPA